MPGYGLKFVLGTTFTDETLQKLRPDSLINDGSLFLIDFGREETAPRNSVPAHNSALVNLAWETAAETIGSGNESTLSATFENTLVGVPSMGLVERSGKYGVHIISSQSAQDGANRYAGVKIPDPIRNHIHANLPGRSFYVSVWGRRTRVAAGPTQSIGYIGDVSNATRYGWNFQTPPTFGPSSGGALVGSLADPNTNAVGNFFRAGGVSDWTSTKPSEANTVASFWIGSKGVYTSFQNNLAESAILWRMYIEDLTESGRSYADTLAADKALYDAAIAPGGRFADDTFTAASTVP